MSLKKINAGIRAIATSAARVNERIHEVAVLIAAHANEHGDCTPAGRLVEAMPASMRRSMLVLWFNTFTPIRVNLSTFKTGMLKAEQKGFVAFDVEAGTAKPFYSLAKDKPEAGDTTLADVNKAVASLIARLTKRVDDGKSAANDADAIVERIAALKAVAA